MGSEKENKQKALKLTHVKYHDFAKKYDILYDEELCKTCIDFSKIVKLTKDLLNYIKILNNHQNLKD